MSSTALVKASRKKVPTRRVALLIVVLATVLPDCPHDTHGVGALQREIFGL
jgi:hypothetical protein